MEDKLLELSKEAIIRYFNTLTLFGYKKYSDVNKMIVLFFMEEFLINEFSQFVTEEDYRAIINALYCMFGTTCLIDIPLFPTYDSLVHDTTTPLISRISEDSILRSTECDYLREV